MSSAICVVPTSKRVPLNSVELAIRSISLLSDWYSWSRNPRSFVPMVSEEAWTANSRKRTSMLVVSMRPPSAVCTSDTPSSVLRLAMFRERTSARRFSEIAKPAASSAALLIRSPEASLFPEDCKASVEFPNLRCAVKDAMLVRIRKPITLTSCH